MNALFRRVSPLTLIAVVGVAATLMHIAMPRKAARSNWLVALCQR